uniref:Transmembrane protein n=1 Tax=Microcystis aeruginosa (strain PCC 7806) TaxID=267872 RepID=A8YG87_MICA7|nr:unnamed protein product [Microcystis aeruginosa PCC 7806]
MSIHFFSLSFFCPSSPSYYSQTKSTFMRGFFGAPPRACLLSLRSPPSLFRFVFLSFSFARSPSFFFLALFSFSPCRRLPASLLLFFSPPFRPSAPVCCRFLPSFCSPPLSSPRLFCASVRFASFVARFFSFLRVPLFFCGSFACVGLRLFFSSPFLFSVAPPLCSLSLLFFPPLPFSRASLVFLFPPLFRVAVFLSVAFSPLFSLLKI